MKMPSLRVTWIFLFVVTVGLADPTPQPSVEPSSASTTSASITTSTTSSSTTASDLKEESQDQVAILKQINRVNDDGSYTFGYEAADGSFKIETRDVAGNVKGMFGFVDDGGELKRISYTASNGTGYQTTGSPNIPPLVSHDGEPTTRISLLPGATTEKPGSPIYIYKVTTRAPRPQVIQHIPKLRPTPATLSTAPTESEEVTDTNLRRPTYGSVLPRKSPTPNYITLGSSTSIPEDEEDVTRRPTFVQTVRPRGFKKILVTKRPVELSTISPATTTPVFSSTLAPDLSQEMMETGDDLERQVESNSLADTGLITSGTEDSPDVYGVNPTSRPYPADAYQTLFSPLPQYQRILQGRSQLLAGGGGARLPPSDVDGDSNGKNTQESNASGQDQATQSQSLVPGRRLPQEPLPQDPRLSAGFQDPRLPSLSGLQDPRLAGLGGAQDPRLSALGGIQDPRLPSLSGLQDPRLYGQDPRLAGLGGVQDPRLSGLSPNQRLPPIGGLQDPRLSGRGGYQDAALNNPGQDPRFQDSRLNGDLRGQDPRLGGLPQGGDPRFPGYDSNRDLDPRFGPGGQQDPRQQQEDPRLYGLNSGIDPRLRGDPRLEGQGLPIPGTQGKVLTLPQEGPATQRPYQGLVFPSGPGRQRFLPPPGAPSPLDYSTTARSLQTGNAGEVPLPPPAPPRRPLGRRPQVLPPSSYNPSQGLDQPDGPTVRPPQSPPQYPTGNPYIMEQLIRMLIASQARQQPGLSPFQQALLATLGTNNVPPELLRNPNYDPRTNFYPRQNNYDPRNLNFDPRIPNYDSRNYDPRIANNDPRIANYDPRIANYDPRVPNYDPRNANFDPRYQRFGPYQRESYNPYPPQAPYDPRYPAPYPDQFGPPYSRQNYPINPYQGYNSYQGVSPNPYYQMSPEEALLRMFLSPRFPGPIPQNDPQIQNSPYDNAGYAPRQPTQSDYDQSVPGSIFGQRVAQEGNIVQRSPPPPAREASRSPVYRQRVEASQRSTTVAPRDEPTTRTRPSFVQRVPPSQRARVKGSRNVQIIDDSSVSASTTTVKP